MFHIELKEGKDWSPQLGQKEFDDCGKTVGLMFQMSCNLWNLGKIVTMDSGFCVSKGIIAMKEKGVFGEAFVKPRGQRWSVLVPGKYIDEYFATKPISHCKTLEQLVDGVKFFIHCQKEEKCVTKIMSCHGDLTPVEDHKTSWDMTYADGLRSIVQFKYWEPISHHNQANHWVDDTNNLT